MYVGACSQIQIRLQDKDHAAYVSGTESVKFVMKYQERVQTTNTDGRGGDRKGSPAHTSLAATDYVLK